MNEIVVQDNIKIEDLIYKVRGKLVILDYDLARVYNSETRIINQTVKRNSKRFPEEFCFQLNELEYENLKSHFVISSYKNNYGGRRTMPYCFTEQGVAMISALLNNDIAIKTSIVVMNAFVTMRKFISSNLLQQEYINNLVLEHDNDIKLLKETFSEFKTFSKELFFEGQIYDAHSLLLDMFNTSKESIVIIDNYISKELLDILCKTNKKITIYTKNIDNNLINKYRLQYNNITIKITNSFHDRFIIIDNKVLYHCGASFKDLGKKCFGINKINDNNYLNELITHLI